MFKMYIFVFIHPSIYMPCTVRLWSRFYYQVNEWILPTKTSSRTCWSIFNQSKSTYKTTLSSHNYGKWWRQVRNVWSVLKMQLILSESQKSLWKLSWRGITLHIVYFGLQKHLNGQYFISSRFSSNEVRFICVKCLYGRAFVSCSCSGQTAEAAVPCIESGPFKYYLRLSALWSCAIKKWNVILSTTWVSHDHHYYYSPPWAPVSFASVLVNCTFSI